MIFTGLGIFSLNAYSFFTGYFASVMKPSFERETVRSLSQSEVQIITKQQHKIGEQIGILAIPRLKLLLPIYYGTDQNTLKKGVGHNPKSAFPGEQNNTVLSGHRDTVFRELRHINKGDLLTVTTNTGEFTYKVKKVRIVDEQDRTILVPKPRATLTLTTCYPFYFIGDARERFIVISELVKSSQEQHNTKDYEEIL